MEQPTAPKLIVRQATTADIPALRALTARCYPGQAYTEAMLRGVLSRFPEGQLVALYEDKLVGLSFSFRIGERTAFKRHTWSEITGGGFAARHKARGSWLYGMESCVDPDFRGWRIGQRLYRERRRLAENLNLRGIVFVGRMPGLRRHKRRGGTVEDYIDAVMSKRLRDPTLSFQMRNGFEVEGVWPDYLPSDKDSLGHGAVLVWRNPSWTDSSAPHADASREPFGRAEHSVRIGVVQYQQRQLGSFDEFGQNVEYFVDVIADYQGDFVVFPELFTLQLLSIDNAHLPPDEAVATLTQYTGKLKALLQDLAVRYNINIIGGSHPTKDADGRVKNICFVCLRDGSVHEQAKIHPTPNERYWWRIEGGDELHTIDTDVGPIGVLICYDSEFPELARSLVDQGARLLFVPFCTDERQSYLRVRYCAQARAVENQCYVAMAGNVGNLPRVENMDIQYAQSCILTPCDFPFARDGIAADTTPNAEMVAIADLRLSDLERARQDGTVQNLRDRRFDLYRVEWRRD